MAFEKMALLRTFTDFHPHPFHCSLCQFPLIYPIQHLPATPPEPPLHCSWLPLRFWVKFHIILLLQIVNSQSMQKYQILSAIGEGAYGVVLKCRDIESSSFVAIKKFKESDEEEHTKKTTMREVKILKLTNHPNIVELREAFRKKGVVYLVFEYLENNLLEVLQKAPGGLKLPLIRRLVYQILKGLAYLHAQNIVHRDIKPENLLVNREHRLKICDFGFARQLRGEGAGVEELTDYVATRWYRPPELLVGGEYGRAIDMWAVACIMCELIDGNPLFPGENELDQLFLIQKSLGSLPPDLHERFLKNQRFLGMKFPEIQNLDRLEKKYFGKICAKGLSLIKGLLRMNPRERMTAEEALQHPFFEAERDGERNLTECIPDGNSRKEIYTSTTNRKKQTEESNAFERATKYGKIYNKRNKNFDAVAQVYQSSNNCKLGGSNAKSLGKSYKKHTYNQEMSLEKHYNKDLLMKTDARGFYIDAGEDKLSAFGDLSKKSTEIGSVASNQQLPFLLYSQQVSEGETHRRTNTINANNKKKPSQILVQKQTFNIKHISHK